MGMQKFFADKKGKFEIHCPRCGKSREVSANDFISKHKLKAKCKCTAEFSVRLEFRGHHRKETRLDGFVEDKLDPRLGLYVL